MTKRRFAVPNPGPTLIIGVFLYLGHIERLVAALRNASPAVAFAVTYHIGMALAVANWMRADRHRLGLASSFDDGFYIFLAWPLALPYYLFASRGPRGGLAVLGFLGLYVLTFALALPLYPSLRSLLQAGR